MNKFSVGIDISKRTFDVCFLNGITSKSSKYQYNQEQMNAFVKKLKTLNEDNVVKVTMEATGNYYLKLATMLIENDMPVAVVNPLKIKRFSQMKMYRTKTDKADAKIIAIYGAEQPFEAYKPKSQTSAQIRQILSTRGLYQTKSADTKQA